MNRPAAVIRLFLLPVLFLCLLYSQTRAQGLSKTKNDITISFSGDSKIEVGSHYAGLSFHHSHPVPQRVSFYYPSANSIDHSTDYWFRDTSFAMDAGIKFGGARTEWLNGESMAYELTPYSVKFKKSDPVKQIYVSYRFTNTSAAVVINYEVKNLTKETQDVTWYLRYALDLKTSHSFRLQRPEFIRSENGGKSVVAVYGDGETQNPEIFVLSKQEPPYYQIVEAGPEDSLAALYPDRSFVSAPSCNYIYTFKIAPDESVNLTEIIGSAGRGEAAVRENLSKNYLAEAAEYENSILKEVYGSRIFTTGDTVLDRSVKWAQAMLAVNKHYIDGDIEPMPCPAEYNFYFTHDVLLTDLAAVKFDLSRVRQDLQFITKHANEEKIIPHAYYWKDTGYVTEFAAHDNWNNFWFTIVSAEYLKHSSDTKTAEYLYPYITKALTQAMQTKGEDNLMWSMRPDWWDIGSRYGQRSYMTLLAIRAIRSYLYVAAALKKDSETALRYEKTADEMHKALIEKLWSVKTGYLMNNTDPDSPDEHLYSGSLLAAHYGILDQAKTQSTIATARKYLLDPRTGVYAVYPMDFHQLTDFWKFAGNEAGAKYYYLNGGIWPHINSWYALSLIAGGMRGDASEFIRNVMTLDGIMNGPNGQPAMYEVRNGNKDDAKTYGTVDKPQFMWAAGWYLYSLYSLFGVADNEWNITLSPYLNQDQQSAEFVLTIHNKTADVKTVKSGIAYIEYDGVPVSSYVIPGSIAHPKKINVGTGKISAPVVKTTNSILESVETSNNKMSLSLRAFTGHKNETVILCQDRPKSVLIEEKPASFTFSRDESNGNLVIKFEHNNDRTKVRISF